MRVTGEGQLIAGQPAARPSGDGEPGIRSAAGTAPPPRRRPAVKVRQRVGVGLACDPVEVGRARRAVRECLTAWGLAGATDSVLLVTSELVTNAVRYAHCRDIGLTVTFGDGLVLIEVRDGSSAPPAAQARDPGPGPEEGESGRGLPLVAALAEDWGWTPHDDGTKSTWAVLPA